MAIWTTFGLDPCVDSFPNDFPALDIFWLSPFAWFFDETLQSWSLSSSAYDDCSDELWFLLIGETDEWPFLCSLYLFVSVRKRFSFKCESSDVNVVALPFVAELFLFDWDDSGTESGDASTKQVTLLSKHDMKDSTANKVHKPLPAELPFCFLFRCEVYPILSQLAPLN